MPVASLSVEHVDKWFRQGKKSGKKGPWLQVLDDISMEAYPGEFLSIVGVSGCGKTTLLRILAGLIIPNSGRVVLEGEELNGVPDRIGFVFQDPALLAWETVWRNVQLGLGPRRMDSASQKALVDEQLDLIGLGSFANSYSYQLSGGMQQRVGLARALISKPRLLLLDEPLGALDAFTRVRLQEELSRLLAATKHTSVLVTHDVEEALYLSDRVIVMGGQPGAIRSVITVPGPRPRDRASFVKDPAVVDLRTEITETIMHNTGATANL